MNKEKITVKMAKVILSTTFMNMIPLLLSLFLWIMIAFLGFNWIKIEFQNDTAAYPLLVIIWMLVMMSLTRILIPHPSVTWSEETLEEVQK